jgi:hypothetical protein
VAPSKGRRCRARAGVTNPSKRVYEGAIYGNGSGHGFG